jgi:hypothetical protein
MRTTLTLLLLNIQNRKFSRYNITRGKKKCCSSLWGFEMITKRKLKYYTYGIPEFSILFMFSGSILLNVFFEEEFTSAAIINVLVLIMIIPLSVWTFINKRKGNIHFFAAAMRFFLLVLTVDTLNFDSIFFEDSEMGLYGFIVFITISIVCLLINFIKENRRWDNTFERFIKTKKIDIEHKKFRLLVPVIHENIMPKRIKKGFLIVSITIFLIILFLFGRLLEPYFYRILFIVLGGSLSGMVAQFLYWGINLTKIEKKINIEFLTEYAD